MVITVADEAGAVPDVLALLDEPPQAASSRAPAEQRASSAVHDVVLLGLPRRRELLNLACGIGH